MNSTGDEVLWQYGPDSPNLVVLEEVVKVEAYDRIKYGISEKYQGAQYCPARTPTGTVKDWKQRRNYAETVGPTSVLY